MTKLKKLLNERGMSALAFAKQIKIPARTIQAICAGRHKPSLKTALKIAAGLKINDLDKLF